MPLSPRGWSMSQLHLVTFLLLMLASSLAWGQTPTVLYETASVSSPTAVGTQINLTATPDIQAALEYKFRVKYIDEQGVSHWTTIQDYSTANTCSWTPPEAHYYDIIAYTRLQGTTVSYLLYRDLWMTVNPAVSNLQLATACQSPTGVGTGVRLTATPTNGGTLEYKFAATYYDANNVLQTVAIRDYTASNNTSWAPQVIATYSVMAYVREKGKTTPYDQMDTRLNYQVVAAVSSLTLVASPTSVAAVGQPVSLSTTPNGGGTLEYRFKAKYTGSGGTSVWQLIQDYSSVSTCTWTPPEAHAYTVYSYAREQGWAVDYTAFGMLSYTVNTNPVIFNFTPISAGVGMPITINGTNFTGATAVKFNGVNAASYSVVSTNAITAVVPTDASTGKITVTTASGTATSSANFTLVPTPTITSFTPTSAHMGETVTITGTNFTGATAVKFNGIPALNPVITATTITATVPIGATTGPITVTTPGGTATGSTFTVQYAAPNITSFNPTTGTCGTLVTLTGANFGGATEVKFISYWSDEDFTVATNINVPSSTTITVNVPDWTPGHSCISVTTPGGTFRFNNYYPTILLTVPYPTPTITSFTPTTGERGVTEVTITGTNFDWVNKVSFEGANASIITRTGTTIKVLVPANANYNNSYIYVQTPGGYSSARTATTFYIAPPVPTITSFTPTSGPPYVGRNEERIYITGTGFSGGITSVKFNGKVATWSYYPSINDTLIYAIVPEDATSGPITITTLGGTATSTQNFIVTVPPTITGLSATCGVAGNTVTITGTNFTGATDVKFNGTTATYTVVNGTTITATVPSGATTGAIVVTVPGGTATSGTFTLTYTVTQSAGKPGDTVIIAGSGFTGATAVKIGGITIPGNKTITATSITFTVPTGLVTGKQDVTVTLADATVVGVGTFYVVPNIIWDECWNVGYDVAGNLIVIVQLRLTDNNGEGVAGHDVRWRLDRINLSAVPNTLIYRDAPRYDNRGVNDYGEILMNGDFSPASDEYGYYWMYYRLGADGADVDVYVGADDFSIN